MGRPACMERDFRQPAGLELSLHCTSIKKVKSMGRAHAARALHDDAFSTNMANRIQKKHGKPVEGSVPYRMERECDRNGTPVDVAGHASRPCRPVLNDVRDAWSELRVFQAWGCPGLSPQYLSSSLSQPGCQNPSRRVLDLREHARWLVKSARARTAVARPVYEPAYTACHRHPRP